MTESKKKQTAAKVVETLEKIYPEARIQLNFSTPFELLTATILSAQCTDERVNRITAKLFQKYKSIEEFAELKPEELEQDIFSAGYYKAKAKHVVASARMILTRFAGVVPDNIDDLTSLPGVGRKTANVVLGHVFGRPAIVVDTHVGRLARRIGLSESKNPDKVESDLARVIPLDKQILLNHLFISHGRAVCASRKPKCEICAIANLCERKI